MATTSTYKLDHSWMEGNAGWERCTNPSRPLCNSSQGWTVNRWSLCAPMFVHQTVNQAALYTPLIHTDNGYWGTTCSLPALTKVPSVGDRTWTPACLWCPYRHHRPYWHTPTVQTYSIHSVVSRVKGQFFLTPANPTSVYTHSGLHPPPLQCFGTCSWSQDTLLSSPKPGLSPRPQTTPSIDCFQYWTL